ncbi:hypothetical protein ACWDRB_66610 [Nonomuraea sp. NPDC003707]
MAGVERLGRVGNLTALLALHQAALEQSAALADGVGPAERKTYAARITAAADPGRLRSPRRRT